MVRLFTGYYQEGTPVLRRLAAWMLHVAHPPARRAIVLENAPLNVEAAFNSRGADRFLRLIDYTGDKRMVGAQRQQDFSGVSGIRVRIVSAIGPTGSCWRRNGSRFHSSGKTAGRCFRRSH